MPGDLTYVTNAGSGRKVVAGARLLLIDGPDAPAEMNIPPAGVTVGNAPDCNLRLNDKRVSRNHLDKSNHHYVELHIDPIHL